MSRTLRTTTVPALEAVPGLVHGFEQRLGPPGWEDRDETRRRMAQALAGAGRLQLLKQVHGCRVHAAPWDGRPEADAAVADEAGLILGIETADCQPILLVDPVRRRVAAAHAGWRGTVAGVAREAVGALLARGSRPADVMAALGPSIGSCCYEVGEELRGVFGPDGAAFFRPGPRGKPHLDVRAANVRQLEQAGLAPDHIHHVADCTMCRADLYHSYRREGKGAGRMVNFVGFAK
ncbi:MAG: peptidoglycan editing factor PgeF [Acidobacteria bacterium]|nr:MAG: peptidoglycan editing factor PgeF [Acidobacteriota bacterium]